MQMYLILAPLPDQVLKKYVTNLFKANNNDTVYCFVLLTLNSLNFERQFWFI